MLERLPPTKRNLALALIAALVLWFLWSIRAVLNPLLVGYLCAYILHPLVLGLQRRGYSRRGAVNSIFLTGFVLGLLATFGVLGQSKRLIKDVLENREAWGRVETQLHEFEESADAWLAPVANLLSKRAAQEEQDGRPNAVPASSEGTPGEHEAADAQGAAAAGEREPAARDVAAGVSPEASALEVIAYSLWKVDSVAEGASRVGLGLFLGGMRVFRGLFSSMVELVSLLILLPLYTYYLLFELETIHAFVRRYLPIGERERLVGMLRQVGEMLSTFFRGRLLVCVLKGLVLTVGLSLAGVDYAFLFGMGSGMLSLVPFIGPLLGFSGAFLVAILDHGVVGALVRAGVVFSLGEMLEGYVLLPKILGDSLGLHEVVVLFALLAGGAALGLFGILAALPLTAALVIVFRELVLPALRDFADEDRSESPPGEPPRPSKPGKQSARPREA